MRVDRNKYEMIRAEKCLSVEDICKNGFPKGSLWKTLNKGGRPETIGKLAKAMGCKAADIVEQ